MGFAKMSGRSIFLATVDDRGEFLFIQYYNYERPHMALNYKTPAEAYFRDVPHVVE
jgi:transposase InsO family protein